MKINYYLEKGVKDCTIRAKIVHKGNQKFINTKYRISKEKWDKNSKTPNRSYSGYRKLRDKLDEINDNVNTVYQDQIVKGEFNFEYFIQKVEPIIKESDLKEYRFISQLLDDYIVYLENNKSKSITKNLKTFRNHFNEFQENIGFKLSFEQVDFNLMQQLENFLTHKYNPYTHSYGLSKNTVTNNIKKFKMLMEYGLKKNIHNSIAYKSYSVKWEKVEDVTINLSELHLLLNTNYDSSQNNLVRDIFCFMVTTAQRYSTINNMEWSDVDLNNSKLNLWDVKTRQTINIPLADIPKEILNKYWDLKSPTPLPRISNQKFNKRIKEVCKIAGLNGKISVRKTIGGKVRTIEYNRFEKIASHSGRRSGCTILHNEAKMPLKKISELSGHKSLVQLQDYIRSSAEPIQEELNDAFKKKG